MAFVEDWIANGGGNNLAPNSCWIDQGNGSVTGWQAQFTFQNADGSNKVISGATCGVWDVTGGANLFSAHFTSVFSIGIGPVNTSTAVNNHTIALYVNYDSGTLPDHCLVHVTAQPGGTATEHAMFKIRRGGAWVKVSGHLFRIRRGGVWKPISAVGPCSDFDHQGGFYVRRSGAWTTRQSPW